MNSLPLVRIQQLLPTVGFLETLGAGWRGLAGRVGLPVHALEDDEAFVHGHRIYRFLAEGARAVDLDDLGTRVAGEADIEELHFVARPLVLDACLADRLHAFFQECAAESSHMRLWIEVDSRRASSIHYTGSGGPETPGFELVEQYMVVLLTRFIRAAGHPSWSPRTIGLQAASAKPLQRSLLFFGTRFRLGCADTSVAVENALLWARGVGLPGIALARPDVDSLDQLRVALTPYLREGAVRIELAAEISGVSPRTLQRRLADAGTSFRTEVERLRRDLAMRQLRESPRSLKEIAGELGYSDAAHFTRAFRRWTGLAPSAFRAALRRTKNGAPPDGEAPPFSSLSLD